MNSKSNKALARFPEPPENVLPLPQRCAECEEYKPPGEFKDRRTICQECLERRPERIAEEKDQLEREARLRTVVSATIAANLNVSRVAEVANEMVKKFGGMEAFCTSWYELIEKGKEIAKENGRGLKTVLDAHYAVFKMIQAASIDQREQWDFSEHTVETLDRALVGYLERRLLIKANGNGGS